MTDNNEATRIYAVLKRFDKAEWRTFVRTKLGVDNMEMEECEENYRGDLREQRYQMVRRWQVTNGRSATVDSLEQLAVNWKGVSAQTQPAQTALSLSHREDPHSMMSAQAPRDTNTVKTPVSDLSSPEWPKSMTTKTASNGSAAEVSVRPASYKTNPGSSGAATLPQSAAETKPSKAFSNDSPGQKKKNSVTKVGEGGPQINGAASKLEATELHSLSQVVVQDGKKKKPSIKKKVKEMFGLDKKTSHGSSDDISQLPYTSGSLCDIVKTVKVLPMPEEIYNKTSTKRDFYDVAQPKGCVLILNNAFETDEKNIRLGSDKDYKNMEKLWMQLGCDLYGKKAQREKTAREMRALLHEMTQLKKKYSFIVIVIMTHGDTDEAGDLTFRGIDHKSVKVRELEKMFNNQNAKALHDVPKFFIFQFCRGKKLDKGVVSDNFEDDQVVTTMKSIVSHTGAISSSDAVVADGGELLPSTSDTLIAYATQAEHTALRHPGNGSWFINAITNVFMNDAKTDDVEHMLTKVHGAMKEKKGRYEKKDSNGKVIESFDIKAMSKHETSLSKRLHLYPGHPK